MARTLTEIQDDLAAVAADQTAIKAGIGVINDKLTAQAKQIEDLQAQLATGSPVTQSQLDALAASADDIKASADALAQSVAPPTPPQA